MKDADMAMAEIPEYVCHKRVRAAKITRINHDMGGDRARADGDPWRLDLDNNSYVIVEAAWFAKHSPKEGGYFVRYQDGYESWSPADAFDSGYTRA